MLRRPENLADREFDLLIIGGGITGVCVARDAALRGLRVALIEKHDFAHATSAHNSKLIHGGLRYLRNFELGLVRESLAERRIWQRIAPHLVSPLPFLVPLYHSGWRGRAMLGAGLSLYDLLSYDRGWLDDASQRLPGHTFLPREAALAREPALAGDGFEGAFVYADAQMYSPERLALECVISAAAHGAACANYVAAETLILRNGRVSGAHVREQFSDASFDIIAKNTLLAAGPWSDLFLEQALGRKTATKLVRSKGIHLIVPAMTRADAITVAAKGGHFFVLPWRGHTILGTTDTAFDLPPDQVGVSECDIEDFLAFVNAGLPSARLRREDVLHFYAGLRPLVSDGSADTYGASRKAELIDHGRLDGLPGLYSAIGGKWTTSRRLAERIVDVLAGHSGKTLARCSSARMRLPGGWIDDVRSFLGIVQREYPGIAAGHLARLYGTRIGDVVGLADDRPELLTPLSKSGDIGAQVLHAVQGEMAMTLEDVVMRRTGIGQLGDPGGAALARTAAIMAEALGWDDGRVARELSSMAPSFQTQRTAP